MGIAYFFVYYFLFSFVIKKFDLKTPGRDADSEAKLYTRKDLEARKQSDKTRISSLILQGLGGKDNIKNLDCCATRLRVTVINPSLVEEAILKESGASGVIAKGEGIQIIYGPRVTVIKSNLEDYIENGAEELPEQNLSQSAVI